MYVHTHIYVYTHTYIFICLSISMIYDQDQQWTNNNRIMELIGSTLSYPPTNSEVLKLRWIMNWKNTD